VIFIGLKMAFEFLQRNTTISGVIAVKVAVGIAPLVMTQKPIHSSFIYTHSA
jgi:hypothetical protein